PEKTIGRQKSFKMFKGFGYRMLFTCGSRNVRVIDVCFAPDNFWNSEKLISFVRGYGYPFRMIVGGKRREQYVDPFIKLCPFYFVKGFMSSLFKFFFIDRFQQIIYSRKLECLNGILLVGGSKNQTKVTI